MKKYLIILLVLLLSSCATHIENIRVVKHGPWIPDSKVYMEDGQMKYSIGVFGWRWLLDYDVIRSEN